MQRARINLILCLAVATVTTAGVACKRVPVDGTTPSKGAQSTLGVPAAEAEKFYTDRVDEVVKAMAMDFYNGRAAILDRIKELKG